MSQNGGNGARTPSANAQQHRWRTWQSDDDIPQRKILIQHMYVIGGARKRARKRDLETWGLGLPSHHSRVSERDVTRNDD